MMKRLSGEGSLFSAGWLIIRDLAGKMDFNLLKFLLI
jgi:hypothetical protein